MRVRDIMRPLEEVATGSPEDTIVRALERMTAARTGAILVLDENGGLAGIFTHGDFARAYQEDPAIGNRPLADFMTPAPVSIIGERLAGQALHLLEEHPVDDLPVVDDEGRVIGLVDTQDLGRFRIV